MSNQEDLSWQQMVGESDLWYGRFVRYLLLPGNRSYLQTYKLERDAKGLTRLRSLPRSWRNATKKYFWKDRAAKWDANQRKIQFADWNSRQEKLRETQWEMSQLLIEKAKGMLEHPLVEIVEKDEQTIIVPSRWSLRDAAHFSEVAANLAQASFPPNNDDAIAALEVLVKAGWIPGAVLEKAGESLEEAKQKILKALEGE